jgi:4'-phosphopantetheinyl transferase
MLRHAVAKIMGIGPAEVVIDRTCIDCGQQHGAPRVISHEAKVPFVSVSHSGLLIAVAVSEHGPIGVDVQREEDVKGDLNAVEWVRREASFKSGLAEDAEKLRILDLEAPLAGYAAALAVTSGTDLNPTHRYWP